MSEGDFDPSGDQAVSSELAGVLPVDFTAFHSQQHRAYLRYAHLQLGNPKDAEEVVDDVFTFLLKVWRQALKEASLHGFAWAVLREHVERRLAALGRQVAMVETAWFAALRRSSRERLELLESKLGLYAAIMRPVRAAVRRGAAGLPHGQRLRHGRPDDGDHPRDGPLAHPRRTPNPVPQARGGMDPRRGEGPVSDMPRHRDMPLCELDAALADATVLADEYAGYDEGAARRRIARRIVADRARSAIGTTGPPAP